MAPAPLRSPPGRPLTHSGGSARHGKKKEEQRQRQRPGRPPGSDPQKRKQSFNSSLPRALTDLIHAWRGSTRRSRTVVPPPDVIQPSPGNCRRRGGVGWQDRWRHGPEACLGRVGQDAQPRSCRVRRTAHTSKAPSSPQGWVYGVSCQPTPPRPTHRNPEPLWLWLWLWPWPWLWPLRVQGATLPNTLRCARRAWPGATRNKKAAFRRPFCYFSLISRRRSSRKPCAVIGSGYRLGFSSVMHEGSTSIRKSGFGCRKNGTE